MPEKPFPFTAVRNWSGKNDISPLILPQPNKSLFVSRSELADTQPIPFEINHIYLKSFHRSPLSLTSLFPCRQYFLDGKPAQAVKIKSLEVSLAEISCTVC